MICIEPFDRILYIGHVEGDSVGPDAYISGAQRRVVAKEEKRREGMRSLLVLCAVRVAGGVVYERIYSSILCMCRHTCVLVVHYYVSSCYYIWAVRVGRIHIEVVVYYYVSR